jgi:hypothetical protein
MKIHLAWIITALITIHFPLLAQEDNGPTTQGRVLGEFFGDFYYKFQGDTGAILTGPGEYQTTEKNYNAFGIRRVSFGYEHPFNETFTVRILLEGSDASLLPNNTRSIYIKIAQIVWHEIMPGSRLIIGSQTSLTFPRFSERIWGYRNVEKSIIDFRRLGASFDMGVSLEGRFNKQGTLGYALMVGNGTGQKPENDKYKKLYGSINSRLYDKFLTELYFDWEPDSPTSHTTTYKGFLGYQIKTLTLGLEPFRQITKDVNFPKIIRSGTSLFVRAQVAEKIFTFLRTDFYNPDAGKNGLKEMFFLTGLDFRLQPKLSLIPNVWVNSYFPETADIPDRKSDVVGRVTFSFRLH